MNGIKRDLLEANQTETLFAFCKQMHFNWFIFSIQGELYWTHHWQKNITIPELKSKDKDRFAEQDKFPEDDVISDTSSRLFSQEFLNKQYPKIFFVLFFRDYPELYLESDYGQRTDRDADVETEQENNPNPPKRQQHH